MIAPELVTDGPGPCLAWRFSEPMSAISSAPLGGGLGHRAWVVIWEVDPDYAHEDPETDVRRRAQALGLEGDGVGFLTAVSVAGAVAAEDDGVRVDATVGVARPTWAAGPEGSHSHSIRTVGTINVVVQVPAALSDGALVNAIATVAEAKAQALGELGIAGTGTASDAACILSRGEGPADPWGGPRSRWGSRIARSVHAAVLEGVRVWD